MSAVSRPRPAVPGWLARSTAGFTAIGVKELRGRMRGKRAFVLLTVYLALMALFAWMVLGIVQTAAEQSFGGGFVASQIGQQLFVALLMLETLLVPFLAPALTASAISLEREKQTLDMLSVTPISSLGLVLGKLFSALTYVFLLIFASIPLTALVFVFGGVGPDDLARGYLVLVVTAIGFGAIGLFFSALVQRTQAATVLTYFVVFALTMGALFVWVFLRVTEPFEQVGARAQVLQAANRTPAELLYFNPFISQADVICGTETSPDGAFCAIVREITGRNATFVTEPVPAVDLPIAAPNAGGREPGVPEGNLDDIVAAPAFVFARDMFWPQAMLAWIGLSVVLIALSVRLVGPRRGRGRRRGKQASAP
jgi:ABC-type transport system involved in multi-copper enzyme maturation permease subunit